MANHGDLTGKRFGRLVVLRRAEDHITPAGNKSAQWLCKCDCGNMKVTSASGLYGGRTKSCGCYNVECIKSRTFKHGQSYTRIHRIWDMMKSRCYYKGNNRYEYYGGRGIVVCDEWKNNFIAFYEWAMSNGYSDELSIDRIDLNGNYEPSNCRWATKVEQANNKSNNRFITFNNQTHTASQWAKITGIKEATIRYRIIHSNWNVERALTTPVRNAKKGAKK